MNVTELTEALDGSRTPSAGPDLEAIRRQGRRIRHRRRAGAAAVAAVTAALVAVPFTMLHDASSSDAPVTTQVLPESPEAVFLRTAPLAAPVGEVVGTAMKAYVRQHGSSVGALSLWAEAAGTRLAYGSRAIDGDQQVRRIGFVDAPVLPTRGGRMAALPGSDGEPTYVGLIAVDASEPVTATVQTRSLDTIVHSGVSATADPGYLLVWVTATTGSEPGIDLKSFTVRGPGGQLLARGTFS